MFHGPTRTIASVKAPASRTNRLADVEQCVEEFFTPKNKFSWYHLIEGGSPPRVGSSITMRSNHIDMSVGGESCRYDKSGYKRFVKDMKRDLFGNAGTRMTAEGCEEFFGHDDNFESGI